MQDSADSRPPLRASGNSAFAGGRVADWRLTTGVYDSRSEGIRNLSSYLAVGRELAPWLDAEVFVLQSRPDGRPTSTTPLANLRWRVSPHLGLMQQLSYHDRRATVLLGANLLTGFGEFGVDYQIVHQPFQPFRSALNLTARLQLGIYSTSFGTYVRPDGAVDYTASGSTFLYMGSSTGAQPIQTRMGIARYVIRGTVHDESGAPVEGAALDLGGEMVFTNSAGVFFLHDARPRHLPLTVLLREFLLGGRWALVSAPESAEARPEGKEQSLEVVLRRIDLALPDTTASLALPAAPPLADPDRMIAAAPALPGTDAAVETIDLDREILAPHRVPARFRWGSREILPSYRPALDSLAARPVVTPTLRVEIQGHADATGGRRQNLALSRARAETVRRYLVAHGVPAERIQTVGFGSTRPIANNATPEGRARYRRVELRRAPD